MPPVTISDIVDAHATLAPHVVLTALSPSAVLSEGTGSTIAVKAEHSQHTGSFKFRGALNRLAALSDDERRRGVVTASSGNHGVGVARAAGIVGVAATVVVPTGASPSKLAAIRSHPGVHVVTVRERDAIAAERHARVLAGQTGATYVSPYNDPMVIAGQATIAVEVTDQVPAIGWEDLSAIVVAVGGGGLIGGIGTWVRAHHPDTVVVAAQPAADAVMAASIVAGHVVDVDVDPTLSDGTAGNLEHDTITFELCQRVVDEWVLVSEHDIARTVALMIDGHHSLVEGAAAVALHAARAWGTDHPGARVVAVSCGANISSARLADALALATSA